MRYEKDDEYGSKKPGRLLKAAVLLIFAALLGFGAYDTFFGSRILKTKIETIVLKTESIAAGKTQGEGSALGEPVKIEEDSRSSFAAYDGGFMQCTKDGVKYFSLSEGKKWNDTYTMSNPYSVYEGGYTAVFEPSGRSVRLYDKKGIINTISTDGPIARVSLSENGYVGIISNNSPSYVVSVYDGLKNSCLAVRKEEEENIYPVDIDISDDGKIFAVSYIDASDVETASKILFFYTYEKEGKDYPDSMFAGIQKDGVIIPYIRFMAAGMLAALSDSSLMGINSLGVQEWELELSNEVDGAGFENKNYVALALGDEIPGEEGLKDGTLMFVNMKGKIVSQAETGESITYLRAFQGGVVAGGGNVYRLFSYSSGKALWEYRPGYAVKDIIPVNGEKGILVVDSSSARLVSLSGETGEGD